MPKAMTTVKCRHTKATCESDQQDTTPGGSGSEIDADVALKLLLVVEAQKPKACKFPVVPAGVSGALTISVAKQD